MLAPKYPITRATRSVLGLELWGLLLGEVLMANSFASRNGDVSLSAAALAVTSRASAPAST
eukprot:3729548-Amphidinium_carterae.2